MLTSNEGKALYWGISAWERKRKHTKSTTVSRPKLEDGSPSLLEWHGKRLWKFCQWSMKPLSNGAKRHRFVAVHRRKVSLVSPLHCIFPWFLDSERHLGSITLDVRLALFQANCKKDRQKLRFYSVPLCPPEPPVFFRITKTLLEGCCLACRSILMSWQPGCWACEVKPLCYQQRKMLFLSTQDTDLWCTPIHFQPFINPACLHASINRISLNRQTCMHPPTQAHTHKGLIGNWTESHSIASSESSLSSTTGFVFQKYLIYHFILHGSRWGVSMLPTKGMI